MNIDIRARLAKNYQNRKNWFGSTDYRAYAEFFSTEAGRAGIRKGDLLLEIGFGQGHFLDWARDQGFFITGVEINPDFHHLARSRGHDVLLGNAVELPALQTRKFDAVFLFDVLEHLSLTEIVELFDLFQQILKKTGRILVRVPNGGSPFGRLLQHSDATHVTILTGSKIQDLAQLSGLEVKAVYNGARTRQTGAHPSRKILKFFAYGIRDLIQLAVGLLYYGENIPLDPNLTVILGHDSQGETRRFPR